MLEINSFPYGSLPHASRGARGRLGASVSDLRLPSHPAITAVMLAVMSGGPRSADAGWRQWEAGVSVTQRVGFEVFRIGLQLGDPDETWRQLQGFSALTLDVLTWLLARAPEDPDGLQLVRPGEILDAKACSRCGRERHLLEEQIVAEIQRLKGLRLGLFEDPVFYLAPVSDGSAFVYRLNPTLIALFKDTPWRPLHPSFLAFDHRQNRGADVLAKKLGIYFTLSLHGAETAVRSVKTVLRGIGSLCEVAADGARGGRFADRFEEALLRLREVGLFEVRGGRVQETEERAKGWTRRWLDTEITVRRTVQFGEGQHVC